MDSHDNKTDHDMLLGLCTDMCWLKKVVGNHLRHHFMITMAVAGAALSATTALIILLISK